MKPVGRLLVAITMVFTILATTGVARAGIESGRADVVWGQPDLTSNGCDRAHPMSSSLCHPTGTAVDSHGNLWVSDWSNSRVVMYPFARASGRPGRNARKDLGQYDNLSAQGCNRPPPDSSYPRAPSQFTLCMPDGLAFDSRGALYVADELNNRILVFLHPTTSSGKHHAVGADLVLGQKDFTSRMPNGIPAGGKGSSACGNPSPASACSLFSPHGIAVDASDNLFVADTLNNRVLMWTAASLATAKASQCGNSCYIPATRTWGQYSSFITNCPNQINTDNGPCRPYYEVSTPGASTLYAPQGVAVDSHGDLFIADSANNRVLEYDDGANTGAQNATTVYGQLDQFDKNLPNLGGVSATSLSVPTSVALDPNSNVWISDQGNNRVLKFPPSDSARITSTTAFGVLGQYGSFHNNASGTSSDGSLDRPDGISFDRAGNAYIADHGDNDRVLEYLGLF